MAWLSGFCIVCICLYQRTDLRDIINLIDGMSIDIGEGSLSIGSYRFSYAGIKTWPASRQVKSIMWSVLSGVWNCIIYQGRISSIIYIWSILFFVSFKLTLFRLWNHVLMSQSTMIMKRKCCKVFLWIAPPLISKWSEE